ncbi:MAG: DUF4112 domain-containing protein [Geminicoccaceae bacterium]|nr:DUF4112 domain-containing protein [Geminicoccaceae bacterium]
MAEGSYQGGTRGAGRPGRTTFDKMEDRGRRADPETVRRLEKFAHLLDEQFRIPGTNYRMGLDGLVGLIPGIGDTATALLSSYVILEAYRLGVPNSLIARMLANIGIDWAVGSIPVLGDVFDVAFKANRRNVSMLLRHLREGR